MPKPIANVKPAQAFQILAKGFRYNPYRLALLRRIWVGESLVLEVSCPRQQRRPKP